MANPPQRGGGQGRGGGGGGAANAPVPAKLPGQLCGGCARTHSLRAVSSRLQLENFPAQRNKFTSMKVFWRWSVRARLQIGVAGGTVFVQSGGNRGVNDPPVPAQVSLAAEHYGMLMRNVEKGVLFARNEYRKQVL